MRKIPFVVLGLVALVACGEEDVEPIVGPSGAAVVSETCAADDGAAWTVVVGIEACDDTSVDAPLMLTFDGSAPMAPGTYTISAEYDYVTYREDGERVLGDHTGTLVLDRWDDTAIEGTYELLLEDGRVVTGSFEAPAFCESDTMCG